MSIINTILSLIKEIKLPAFKIETDSEDPDTGLLYFLVKIEGKCTPLIRKDPIELLREGGRSNNCFSDQDWDWIIHNMLENQKRLIESKYKKKFSLIKHQFSEQLAEPLVVFSDFNKKIYIRPAKELYSNLENLKQFSSEDSACIGNIVGSHEAEQEYKFRKQSKKNNNVLKFDISLLSG